MKKVFLSFAMIVALASCNKEDGIQQSDTSNQSMLAAEAGLTVTTRSIISTEAVVEDAEETLEFETDLYTIQDLVATRDVGGKPHEPTPPMSRYESGALPIVNFIPKGSDIESYPYELTIDYGDGTTLDDGGTISGKIIILMSENRRVDGAIHSVTYENVVVHGVALSGTMTKEFSSQGLKSTITKEYFTTLSDGTTIEHRTLTPIIKEYIEGTDTPVNHKDDVIKTVGSIESIDSDGNSYSKVIVEPLMKYGSYKYIVEGTLSLQKNSAEFAIVDYGDGTRDNLMDVTTAEGTTEMNIGAMNRIIKQQQ